MRLCQIIEPIQVLASQVIYEQGKVGSEMYFIMMGEFEVLVDGHRIGFLGQGAFFGENAIIEAVGRKPGMGSEIRMRTMRASADSELGLMSNKQILILCDEFPELEIRLQAFRKAGMKLSDKGHNLREIVELKRRAVHHTCLPACLPTAHAPTCLPIRVYGVDGNNCSAFVVM